MADGDPQIVFGQELVVDLVAGDGSASTGIAIAVHQANHPRSRHHTCLFSPPDGTLAWRPITKTDQVRLIGNSVCPDVAAALVRENAGDLINFYARAA